jgi:septal ring-binding cell division protein DamX
VLAIIADASEGLTRRINIYADKALLAAFAAGTHTVTADHARAAVNDTQIVVSRRESPRRLVLAAAAGAAAGIAIGFMAAQVVSQPSAAPQALAAAAAPAKVAQPAPIPTASAPPAAQPVAAVAPAPAPALPDRTFDARLAAGRELLDGNPGRYAVQLMVADARQRDYVAGYLAEASHAVSPDRLYLVPAGSPEAPRLGVLFGAFDERADASVALASLPESLKQFRPYVRPLEGVREDALRAQRK